MKDILLSIDFIESSFSWGFCRVRGVGENDLVARSGLLRNKKWTCEPKPLKYNNFSLCV